MESCWVTESKPFPVLASSVERSPRVMLFMAVNWVDMAMPSMNRGRMSIHEGQGGRLEGELGNHEADADGDAREGHPVAEPVEDLHGESFWR